MAIQIELSPESEARLAAEEADRRAGMIENTPALLPDSLAVHAEWRRLIVEHPVSGVQVHDAPIVAAMHVHGVRRMLTFNGRDFARYPTIEAMHPQTLLGTIS